jgi:hypothetical protein
MADAILEFGGKFGRRYVLRVQTIESEFEADSRYVEIKYPITCEFNIVRHNMASSNTANFTLYNINPQTRNQIFKDQYDQTKILSIQFFAGYSEWEKAAPLPQVFNGTIKRASSIRNGQDFLTEIEAYDGAINMATEVVSATKPAGVSKQEIMETIKEGIKDMASFTIGDKFNEATKRGVAIMGNPNDLMQQYSNNSFYIDSQNGYVLGENEVVEGEIRLINGDNGLLGTPRKYETLVEVEMLFEPRIKPSQLIELQSVTSERFNGVYKVTGITHNGVISDAVGGNCITKLQLLQIKDAKVIFDQATKEYRVVEP